ncbi:MAG: sialidase family protein [Planctomycetaceae bacterium]
MPTRIMFALMFLVACNSPLIGAEEETYDSQTTKPQPGLLKQEFIYEVPQHPQCHASTIAETPAGLVCAWFGGTHEKNPDVGIWFSREVDGTWSEPLELFNGVQSADLRHPCWNPVLHQVKDGPLILFYKVGPDPRTWWGMMSKSYDNGKSWNKPVRLPDEIPGPIKNKPFVLEDGTLLSPTSTENVGWRVQIDWTKDEGRTWHSSGPLNDGEEIGAIQPSIVQYGDRLQILCRSRQGKIAEAWSDDWGKTWGEMTLSEMPNNNSGTDAVNLALGGVVLIYNHVGDGKRDRSPLNLAYTEDGKNWQAALVFEVNPGEYSYPAIIQTEDGLIHATYTYKRRRVKHVVIDPTKLELRPIQGGEWPK